MKWAIVATILICTLGIIPLMGTPGALALVIAHPIVEPLCNALGIKFDIVTGDRAWPAAILMTFVAALAIVPAYWVAYRKFSARRKLAKFGIFIGVMFAWFVVSTFALQLMNR